MSGGTDRPPAGGQLLASVIAYRQLYVDIPSVPLAAVGSE